MQTVAAAVLLASVLAFAIARPTRLPEAVVAVPAAAVAVAAGLVPVSDAMAEVEMLGPTVWFLAAVLVVAHLAAAAGVFDYAGSLAARIGRDDPHRLLLVVFAIAALVTAALSLDATVVLLTPVVFATAARMGVRARPHVYACTHLANSASLLLPVSNLTNLLAFHASGLSFVRFGAFMALPWLVVIAIEYALLRRFFAADLAIRSDPGPSTAPRGPIRAPRYALSVLALTLVGFAVAGPVGLHPAWMATVGAIALAVPRVRRTPRSLARVVVEANPAFCLFVFALGIVVLAVRRHGLGSVIESAVPEGDGLWHLLVIAGLAAVLANLVNNLPATLLLIPFVTEPAAVLAVLIGVNVGPNLTYVGSLATLLWRQVLHRHGVRPVAGDFLRLGALTVPACLVGAVIALWLAMTVTGTA